MLVSGRVQGVSFRAYTQLEAHRLAVAGWVRNLADGRVEAVFEGTAEAVRAMVAWCQVGSPAAHVERVETSDEEPEGLTSFHIRGF